LLGGILVSGALLASVGMGAMFTFAVGFALHRGLRISCGCFGSSSSEIIGYPTVIRAFAILVCSIAAYICTFILRAGDDGAADGGEGEYSSGG
jgi:hypothetical protein